MPEEFGAAIADFEDPHRELRGAVNLTDILAAGGLLSDLVPQDATQPVDAAQVLHTVTLHSRLFVRLGLGADRCRVLLEAAIPESQQMRSLFGA